MTSLESQNSPEPVAGAEAARDYLLAGSGAPVVLLGAGASVDAGVPASTAMTQAVAAELATDGEARYWGASAALNFCIGAIVGHNSSSGADPCGGIDVELIFSAVQMLAQREDLEVAPFVREWHPALEAFGPSPGPPSSFDRDLGKAILDGRGADRLFVDLIKSVTGARKTPVYSRLQERMTFALRRLLLVPPSAFAYLSPLLTLRANEAPLTIGTLNYDLGIEAVTTEAGLLLDRGIEAWDGAFDWSWARQTDVRLLKLHGSIDWCDDASARYNDLLTPARVVLSEDPKDERRAPTIVFGQRAKLRADGPFLAMLRAFASALEETDRLLIVGYSFRDEHLNVILARWLAAEPTRGIVLVDPDPPAGRGFISQQNFGRQLLMRHGPERLPTGFGAEPEPQRVFVVSAGASEGLAKLLN